MSGRDLIRADLAGQGDKPGELEPRITRYAGVRGPSVQLILHKGPHNRALEFFFEVDDVEWERQVFGDATRVVDVVQRAAARGLRLASGAEPAALIP